MTNRTRALGKGQGLYRVPLARPDSPTALAAELGPCVYAARCDDGAIKIGYASNLANRIGGLGGYRNILAVKPGTLADEQVIHERLRDHVARGREYYHPTDAVLAVVNDMRAAANMQPLDG